MDDHDQRFKTVLQSFLPQFFELLFPDWAARFDFSTVEWLDTEVFPDPPDGARRSLDLVAKLRALQPITDDEGRPAEVWLSLIHIEVESADSVKPLRRRMHRYYTNLRDKHERPVLPVAVYLNVGLEGLGTDEYAEHYGPLRVLHFQYLYVGLPRLDAVEYLQRGNPLGAALASLMKLPRDRRSWLAVEAKQQIAASGLNEQLTFLLTECLEAYLDLTTEEIAEVDQLLHNEAYQEAQQMGVTTFERGEVSGFRKAVIRLLQARFGDLSEAVVSRLEEMNEPDLNDLLTRITRARSLEELDLNDAQGHESP